MDHGGGVVDVDVGIDEADDGGDAAQRLLNDALEGPQVIEDEAAAQQQVLGRVAGQRQLREGDEVGAEVAGAVGVLDDLVGVALEVADGGVDLGQRDAKAFHT